ncbi:MAG: sodium:alanine symporter family protein [Endozoicomonas sp. (ex Botrylloides leachii)]|nr:sodium:alanine symporter family protein [Endozoicomonas sp. (ex Botrylloides leachii)]
MIHIIDAINNLIWGNVLIYLLIGSGLFFTLRTQFVQLRRFPQAFRIMLNSRQRKSETHISPFQAFCTSLAARIGTGNIAGVAIAIYLGGPGAVFWMWIIALFGMATSVAENTLAQLYKTNNHDGTFRGGPAYYIEKAMKMRWLGIMFSIAMIIAYGFAFNSVQANSIALAFKHYGIPNYWIGTILVGVSSLIIFGGIRSISRVAEMIVPVMAIGYMIVALMVVALHITELPAMLTLIVKSAFGLKTAASGGAGYMISQAMMQGVKRGLFSNEAGIGSAPNAAATAHSMHPGNQGMFGMLGVFMDTIIVCTSTAVIILMSGVLVPGNGVTGVQLTQAAMTSEVGVWGEHLVALAILLFAFTSIIANYYYGESSLRFISDNKKLVSVFRLLVLGMIFWGAESNLTTVWAFADLSMGMMTFINLTAILALSKIVFIVLKDYDDQLKQGIAQPIFSRKKFPFLDQSIDKDVWK